MVLMSLLPTCGKGYMAIKAVVELVWLHSREKR